MFLNVLIKGVSMLSNLQKSIIIGFVVCFPIMGAISVDAGPNDTTRLGQDFSFKGVVTGGDNTEITEWLKISGPAQGDSILYPDSRGTKVLFFKIGVYKYRLIATLGTESTKDSVIVTILDSIPFIVLTPSAGQKVVKGKPFTITWQIDPDEPQPQMKIYFSTAPNLGKTWTPLIEAQTKTPWVWNVPADLVSSDSCMLKVQKYFKNSRFTISERFAIVDTIIVPKTEEKKNGCGAGAAVAFLPPIGFKLLSRKKKNSAKKS